MTGFLMIWVAAIGGLAALEMRSQIGLVLSVAGGAVVLMSGVIALYARLGAWLWGL